MRCFATIIEAYYWVSGHLVNLEKSTVIFNSEMKIQIKQMIWDRLGIGEQKGTLSILMFLSLDEDLGGMTVGTWSNGSRITSRASKPIFSPLGVGLFL